MISIVTDFRLYTVSYLTRGSSILGDVIVVAITWAKTFKQWREGKRLNVHTSISTLLLRDGEDAVAKTELVESLTLIQLCSRHMVFFVCLSHTTYHSIFDTGLGLSEVYLH
jgi:hypothetical protein